MLISEGFVCVSVLTQNSDVKRPDSHYNVLFGCAERHQPFEAQRSDALSCENTDKTAAKHEIGFRHVLFIRIDSASFFCFPKVFVSCFSESVHLFLTTFFHRRLCLRCRTALGRKRSGRYRRRTCRTKQLSCLLEDITSLNLAVRLTRL